MSLLTWLIPNHTAAQAGFAPATMQGPEGQIFGPMADTYSFALAGALLLALTLSPVLCTLLFRRLKPARDNFLVRWLKTFYLWQLERCLNYRWLALGLVGMLVAGTVMTFLAFSRPAPGPRAYPCRY